MALLAACGALLMVLVLIALAPAAGAPSTVTGAVPRSSESGGWPLGLDIAAKLIAVVALIYATAAVARRYLLRSPGLTQTAVRVLETTSLAPKKTVYVLEVGGRVLIVGASESSLSTLAEFTDPEEVAGLVASTRTSGSAFQRYLELSVGQRRSGDVSAGGPPLTLITKAFGRRDEGNQ
ncbi:MAG: flagellar biosynthetic protein FliO [Chloroflexi bacterium]|nr:flagellar biosynthetic protein FliO [Chloroflexota bacterium]